MIFFDIDETLMDFKEAEYLAVHAFFDEYSNNFSLNFEEFYSIWCTIGKKQFTRYLNREISFQQQKIERIKEIFNQSNIAINDSNAAEYFKVYLSHFEDSWKPFNDVIPCLEELQGYRLGIISNGDSIQQRMKLKKIGIINYFETIVTASDAGVAKPNIEIFQIACKKAGKEPHECIYIGDDLITDIMACRKASMEGIWLNRRKESQENYKGITITNLTDLNTYI